MKWRRSCYGFLVEIGYFCDKNYLPEYLVVFFIFISLSRVQLHQTSICKVRVTFSGNQTRSLHNSRCPDHGHKIIEDTASLRITWTSIQHDPHSRQYQTPPLCCTALKSWEDPLSVMCVQNTAHFKVSVAVREKLNANQFAVFNDFSIFEPFRNWLVFLKVLEVC